MGAAQIAIQRAKLGDAAALAAMAVMSGCLDEELTQMVNREFAGVLDCLVDKAGGAAMEALDRSDWCTRKAACQLLGMCIASQSEDLTFQMAASKLKQVVGNEWRERIALESAAK